MNSKKKENIVAISIVIVILLGTLFTLAGCTLDGGKKSNINADSQHEKERQKYKQVLNVYNAAEYIDTSTIVDFEKEYKVRVEYYEFESNEDISVKSSLFSLLMES